MPGAQQHRMADLQDVLAQDEVLQDARCHQLPADEERILQA
jgi:hypothetical protein